MNKMNKLVEDLNGREKQALFNALISKRGRRNIDLINFMGDINMYGYPHKETLVRVYRKLYNAEAGVIKEALNLGNNKCKHRWITITPLRDILSQGGKEVKCEKCGEIRYVEIDSPLGGQVI